MPRRAPTEYQVKRYYTDDEVAAGFGVSRPTLARWRDKHQIDFVQLPGGPTVRYSFEAVWQFQERNEHPAKRPRGRPRKNESR